MNSWSLWAPPITPRCRWGSFPAVSSSASRVAQALATDPKVLLCDEPLLSLDLQHQQGVSALIDRQCRDADSAVVFVTHEINPIMDSGPGPVPGRRKVPGGHTRGGHDHRGALRFV